jgi:serine/threonine-protein kinase
MNADRLVVILFTGVLVWLGAETALIWPSLPARVATHFDWTGAPNGWAARPVLLAVMAAVCLMEILLFATLGGVRLSDRRINLPNKAYWLAPERREETLGAIRLWIRAFVTAMTAFTAIVFVMAMRANLDTTTPRLSSLIPWLTASVLGVTLAMLAWLYWRFRAPPNA